MSLRIIKPGILDTIQDQGRFGYRHLGVNPTGAMDAYSASMANSLIGNTMNDAVIEMHFPAMSCIFEKEISIIISGADFSPSLNGVPVPLNQKVSVAKNSILKFDHHVSGARAYLAIEGGFDLPRWLNSYSTHLKAGLGGWKGRRLLRDDSIPFRRIFNDDLPAYNPFQKSLGQSFKGNMDKMLFLPGQEWDWLSEDAQRIFMDSGFQITHQSDRMGYRLSGPVLGRSRNEELVSSPVCFGTIQLLPDGQLILLMADHQTTGGYPRIAHVITAHHKYIAQMNSREIIYFERTDILHAENLWLKEREELASAAIHDN